VALRWPTAFYGGVITGLEELTAQNVLKTVTTMIRLLGGLAVLLIARSLEPFLWWLVGSALLEVGLYAIVCHRLFPGLSPRPGLSGTAVQRVWRFSLSMNAIALTTLVFTQADRVFMSRMLPLDQVGYYSLAVTVVMTISVLQGFVTSALLPAMASDHSHGRTSQLIVRYDKATQILIYALAIPVCVLVFFGHDLLRAWISLEAADEAAMVLALLAAGFLLNASAAMGYTLAVATGHTRLPLVVNVAAAVVYLPALYFAVRALGMTGPAVLWVLLNLYNLITLVPLVHRRVIGGSYGLWLRRNLLPFVLAGAGTFSLARGLTVVAGGGRHEALLAWTACGAAVLVYSVLGYCALATPLRRDLRMMVQQAFARLRVALP
jgi:O-antigen/teichoic acid export membrane protein